MGSPCDDVAFRSKRDALYNGYRLGDVVNGYVAPPGKAWENQTKMWYICKTWPESLACTYRKATSKNRDTSTLSQLLPATRNSNTTVLHLRLGDGVGGPGCWEITCHGPHGNGALKETYTYSRQHYVKILHRLPRRPITVVGNPYHGNTHDVAASLVYLKLVVCFLRSHNFTVVYHGDGNTPDDDFATMATADVFVRGGGGYSNFAASVVRFRGHTVI